MLLVLALSLLIGLVLTTDRPHAPVCVERQPSANRNIARDVPRPTAPSRPARDRLRAHFQQREDVSSPSRSGSASTVVDPPSIRRGAVWPSSRSSDPSPEPLIYTFCTLLI